MEPVQKHSVHTLIFRSLKRTHDMFESDQARLPSIDEKWYCFSPYGFSHNIKFDIKKRDQYKSILDLPKENYFKSKALAISNGDIPSLSSEKPKLKYLPKFHIMYRHPDLSDLSIVQIGNENMILPKKAPTMPKPTWHPPWKLCRVISGHTGWVRCVAFDPTNDFFVTGAADRMIKVWDFASGTLKLTLTGHISTVRGVAISTRQPYLFSCGEDKTVKCWDLEQNKVIRHYHGHMSAVYAIDLHPSLDIVLTCGRDATARVWDMRTKA
ncbi:unnamed protein product, partial [Protopolystoma xenopodis]